MEYEREFRFLSTFLLFFFRFPCRDATFLYARDFRTDFLCSFSHPHALPLSKLKHCFIN